MNHSLRSRNYALPRASHFCEAMVFFCALFTCLCFALPVLAAPDADDKAERAKRLRQADLEWDEIPGAIQYEIEVKSLSSSSAKPILFKTKGTAWHGRLLPGKYRLSLRTYDERGVPGDWGDPTEFWVRIGAPEKLKPEAKAKIETGELETTNIEFSWKPVIGAAKYKIDILDDANQVVVTQTLTDTSVRLQLPVARVYSWRVIGLMPEDEESEPDQAPYALALLGRKLEKPEPAKPINEWVRELEWSEVAKHENFSYTLEFRQKNGSWKKVKRVESLTETKIPFPAKFPGGHYRLSVQANAKNRPSSDVGSREFDVRSGDRSPEAANLAMLKESLSKPSNFYAIASYFITNIAYQGTLKENATNIKFNALGGTGRLGLGYIFKDTPWSTFSIVDLSGFNVGGTTSTFASAEAHVVWRRNWNVSLLRSSAGLFYKELPLALGSGSSQTFDSMKRVASLGPHLGFEFLYPFTYRLGMQANARVYMNAMALSTPNGQPAVPAMSMQLSVLGSYRLDRDLVGFAGYSFRQDNALYNAKPGDPSVAGSGAAVAGDVNSISITGHYLNLILEYAF